MLSFREVKLLDRNFIQQLGENNEQDVVGIPICGAKFSSPMVDTSNFIREVHYKIGTCYISKMQTRDNDDKKQAEEEKRDLELENIVGNLLIAEYQL